MLIGSASGMCGVAMAVVLGGSAFALPIQFRHTGAGSGTLDGVAFTRRAFIITAEADTDARTSYTKSGTSGYFIDNVSARIEIAELGVCIFTSGTRFFVNNSNTIVGFSRAGIDGADLIWSPTNPLFGSWDMLTSIGPIAGNAALLQWTSPLVTTDRGVLRFDNGSSSSTFEATVIPAPGAVSGLAGVLAVWSRRRRKE